jgi:hypothetical protein
MFASNTLTEHLLRGAFGISAFVVAGVLGSSAPLLSLALVPIALVALRGCPMCWTVGLVQTVAKVRGASSLRSCVDGRCATTAPRDSRRDITSEA